MAVDISLLKENGIIDIVTSINIKIPPEYNLAESLVNVDFKGTIGFLHDIYTLNGIAKAKVIFQCDSCLSDVEQEISFEIQDKFSRDISENDDDNEIWAFSEHYIDLENCIGLGLISNLPMKAVCSEVCKGMCPKCGQNFNQGSCDCDNANYDPRFEVLRSLFNETEV